MNVKNDATKATKDIDIPTVVIRLSTRRCVPCLKKDGRWKIK